MRRENERARAFGIRAFLGLLGLGLLLGLGGRLAIFLTDYLWYREVGRTGVMLTILRTEVLLGLAAGVAIFGAVLGSGVLASSLAPAYRPFRPLELVFPGYRVAVVRYWKYGLLAVASLAGLSAALSFSRTWPLFLLFRNSVPFGVRDPLFGKDAGAYVFGLPFARSVFDLLLAALLLALATSLLGHYIHGGLGLAPGGPRVSSGARRHLLVLVALLLALKAWGYYLDQLGLLGSSRGVVAGASYTDVHAVLPGLRLLTLVALVSSLLALVAVFARGWVLPAVSVGLLFLVSLGVRGVYPAFVQKFRVAPQESQAEREYIQRNIEWTRRGFGLERVAVKEFPAEVSLGAEDLAEESATVSNIRLWDPEVLKKNFSQLQQIRPYYHFSDVDVDRYVMDGGLRQVMISAREMAQAEIPESARTWVNQHLVYTHGFGVVATRVDRVTPDGQPEFIVKDIPPAGSPALALRVPQVYFGARIEGQTRYVVVGSAQKELDYPRGETFEATVYTGKGGIRLSSRLLRTLFAWRFADLNLLISNLLTPDSKIMMYRSVEDRVEKVAPFLTLDSDPYVAVVGGRIVWILDAYTTSANFPYSEPVQTPAGPVNYMRNSIKAAVDAYDGTITLYRVDRGLGGKGPPDPILEAWSRAFPGLFTPVEEAPAELLAHFRYPEDLFKVQMAVWGLYHIGSAADFYSKEDAWEVPANPVNPGEGKMPPYYVVMRLPGEQRPEFLLMGVFNPVNRPNMVAWMAARSDPPNYGELVSFVFPKQKSITGPAQTVALINADPVVSQLRTLWGQQGSNVIQGNVLVIPVKSSLLTVQPWYLESNTTAVPELKRVMVVLGDRVATAPDLPGALQALLSGAKQPPVSGGDVGGLLGEAMEHWARAEEALKAGDWGTFGKELAAMVDSVRRARESLGGAAPAGPPGSPSPP